MACSGKPIFAVSQLNHIMPKKNKLNGLSEKTIHFLKQLAANNNKGWFETHKEDYDFFVLQPLKNIVLSLNSCMLNIDPFFETRPMINKTISRIYRDTRFSQDKSPFKTSCWITFKRPRKDWKDAPAYFFEITPEMYRYGMGFYKATPKTMALFRDFVDNNVSDFEKVIKFYGEQKIFVLEGEKYKRPLNDTLPQSIQEWYQRKNFYLVCNRTADNDLFSERLFDNLIVGFEMLSDLYKFLLRVKTADNITGL